jgi:hypothetical protein
MIGPAVFVQGPQKSGGKLFWPGLGLLDTQNIRRIFLKPVQKAVLFNGPYAVYIPGYNTHDRYSISLNAEKMKVPPQASGSLPFITTKSRKSKKFSFTLLKTSSRADIFHFPILYFFDFFFLIDRGSGLPFAVNFLQHKPAGRLVERPFSRYADTWNYDAWKRYRSA